MQKIQLINSNLGSQHAVNTNQAIYSDEKAKQLNQKDHLRMQMNYFDYTELEDMKTRNSTFSKASEGREEIKQSCVSF